MLFQIDTKLNLILEKLYLSGEEMVCVDSLHVSLSSSGIRLCTNAGFALGDLAEVKLLVLSEGAAWLELYGRVARLASSECGGQDTAIAFMEMEDEVREVLIRYTVRRQRELIRKERGDGDYAAGHPCRDERGGSMFVIIGLVTLLVGIVGGNLLEHGNLSVLWQPAELVIIGGSALGAFLSWRRPRWSNRFSKASPESSSPAE